MDRVLCHCVQHCRPCILKTGVSGGRSDGVSFYMCSNVRNRCDFVQVAEDIQPMICPLHNKVISVRVLDSKNPQQINYFCSKKTGPKCGYMIMNDTQGQNEKENLDPEIAMTAKKSEKTRKYDTVKTPALPHAIDSDVDSEPDSGIKSTDSATQQDKYMYSSEHSTPLEDSDNKSSQNCSSFSSPPVVRALALTTDDEEGTCSSVDSPDRADVTSSDDIVHKNEQFPVPCSSSSYMVPEPPSTTELSLLSHDGSESESMLYKSALEFLGSETKVSNWRDYDDDDDDDDEGSAAGEELSYEENDDGEAVEELSYEEKTSSPQLHSSKRNNPPIGHMTQSLSYRDSIYQYDSDDNCSTAQSSESISSHSNTSMRQSPSPLKLKSPTLPANRSELQPSNSPMLVVQLPDENLHVVESDKSYQENTECVINPPSTSLAQPCESEQHIGSGSSEDSSSEESEDSSQDGHELLTRSEHSPADVQQLVILDSSHGADDRQVSFKSGPILVTHKSPELTNNQPIVIGSSSNPKKVSPSNSQLTEKCRVKEEQKAEPEFKLGHQARTLTRQYEQVELMIRALSDKLPDGGAQLRANRDAIAKRLEHLKRSVPKVDPSATSQPLMTTASNRLTYNAKMLTSGAVEHLHSSLENCPTVDTVADDPPGLTVDLMRHQKRALAWMQWREEQKPSAGILADDMGLGKTLSMLSLVLNKKTEAPEEYDEWMRKPSGSEGLVKCPGTLVVCPASLMMQWDQEVKGKLCPGTLKTKIYHGSNRIAFPHELASYDLVITTYNIVGIEASSCPDYEPQPAVPGKDAKMKKKRKSAQTTLFKIHWRRVILDEAHVIRNHKSGQSMEACKLKSDYRWAVTGTPIQNHLKDFYSLIKFIGLAPFDDFRVWKQTVERKGTLGMQRLNTMVSSLVLRRTKEEMSKELAELNLTKKLVNTHKIKLAEEENRVYQVLFREARKVMYHWLQEQGEDAHLRESSEPCAPTGSCGDGGTEKGNKEEQTDQPDLPPEVARLIMNVLRPCLLSSAKGRCVLALLLRLRQCCSHLQLLTRVPKPAESDQDELELTVAMGALHLESDSASQHSSDEPEVIPPEFTREERSTKIEEVINQLQKISESDCDGPPQKSVIVSQWTSMLDIMQFHLDFAGITFVRIDGTVPPAKRSQFVNTFNSPHENPTVMLLSLQAGGVGLNLIGGNHVFILDMHWNPALEDQAADRCHRVGQKRDVFIHKFVSMGTVEERILSLQQKKLAMAKDVLEGASERRRANNKLSLNDLKHLFEID